MVTTRKILQSFIIAPLLAIAACSTQGQSTTADSPAASNATATGTVPTTAPSSAATTSSAQTVDWRSGMPTSETGAALWEALMGPEGEYAAAAAYTAVLNRYGQDVQPYASILTAEQRHADALTRQLERLGVTVPDNPWLGRIPAPDSLGAAATAWADGEVANVAMYDSLLGKVDGDAMATRVFTNLRRASQEQHLPAFRSAAANGGTLPTGVGMGSGMME
ncbi:MAG: hypothetical protein ACK5MP_11595 [Nostocoides sp.]